MPVPAFPFESTDLSLTRLGVVATGRGGYAPRAGRQVIALEAKDYALKRLIQYDPSTPDYHYAFVQPPGGVECKFLIARRRALCVYKGYSGVIVRETKICVRGETQITARWVTRKARLGVVPEPDSFGLGSGKG